MKNKNYMNSIVDLCKRRGFVFPGSEIYGGLSNSWDYGPLGVELKNNIKNIWWKRFVQKCKYNVGLDSSILMNPKVWQASGHITNFNDPLTDCKNCKTRYRADILLKKHENVDGKSFDEIFKLLKEYEVKCPNCGSFDFTPIRTFNLMFKTFQGVLESKKSEIYLRPETAQGIFINFLNIQKTTRKKLPFGVAQIGKSFRNEITPGNFIFRTREFEQMELEFFCEPEEATQWFSYWEKECVSFVKDLGVSSNSIRLKKHKKEELSHYSNATTDVEFLFPFGWGELLGIANRGTYDLSQHEEYSKKNLGYYSPQTNSRYIPACVEPSVGVDRLFLGVLCDSYFEEEDKANSKNEKRVVLKINPKIAPIKLAMLPLVKKFSDQALKIYEDLSASFTVDYDETGSIGRRYRRQDEIGTPFCATYDFESKDKETVTIRDRDTMKQTRISISKIKEYVQEKIGS